MSNLSTDEVVGLMRTVGRLANGLADLEEKLSTMREQLVAALERNAELERLLEAATPPAS